MMHLRKSILFSAITVILISCSGSSDPLGEVIDPANFNTPTHYLEEVVLMAETDDFLFGDIATVQPSSSGYVIVGDRNARTFHIFDQSGKRVSTIGKEGSGPGEFQQMGQSWVTIGDTLLVQDWSNARITAFTETRPGMWTHALDLPVVRSQGGMASSFFHFPGNPMIGQFNRFYGPGSASEPEPSLLFPLKRDGEHVADTIATVRANDVKIDMGTNFVRVYGILFGRTGIARQSDELLHIANSEFFGATTFSQKGDTIAHFRYPVISRPVTEALIQDRTGGVDTDYYKAIRDAIPATRPAFDAFQVDNLGNIYFRFDDITEETHLWLSFDKQGNFLKSFQIEKNTTVHRIKDGHVYTASDIAGDPVAIVYKISES